MLLVLFLYLATIFCISFFVGKKSKDENNREFFTARKKSNWLAVSFGMVGATISGISVISVPGQVISSSFSYMNTVIGFILGYYVVAYVLLPVYYRHGYTSIYQLLGERMGKYTHRTTSIMFLIYKMLGSAIKLFVVAMVLDKLLFPVLGINFYVGTALIVLMIYLYTFRSGVSTVVVTDCIQTLCLFVCSFVLLYQSYNYASEVSATPFTDVMRMHLGKVMCVASPGESVTTLLQFLSGMFLVVVMTGLDQDVMQKNLTCKDLKSAQKNMVLSGYLFVPINFILLVIGALLVIGSNSDVSGISGTSDGLVIEHAQKFGIVAILSLEIGLLSASLSSADSALVGLTTSYFFDLKGVEIEKIGRRQRYLVHGCFAVLLYLIICLCHMYSGKSALDMIYSLASCMFAPLLGLFVFAIFSKKKVKDSMTVLVIVLSFGLAIYANQVLASWGIPYSYSILLIAISLFVVLLLSNPKGLEKER